MTFFVSFVALCTAAVISDSFFSIPEKARVPNLDIDAVSLSTAYHRQDDSGGLQLSCSDVVHVRVATLKFVCLPLTSLAASDATATSGPPPVGSLVCATAERPADRVRGFGTPSRLGAGVAIPVPDSDTNMRGPPTNSKHC